MNEWIAPGMLFVAVSAGLWAVIAGVRRWLVRRAPGPDAEPEPVFGELTPAIAGQLPMSQAGLQNLQRDLMQGGYYRLGASQDFRAIRAMMVVVPLVIGGAMTVLVSQAETTRFLIYTAVATILGYTLPRAVLAARMRYRARQIERGLPLAIDLLTLCLSAGQNLLLALQHVGHELRNSHPILAQELTIAYQHAQLHSLTSAMAQWAARARSPEVTNLSLILIQSEELGTDTAATLQEMSNTLRTTARQRAEGQANKASFWMLLPTIFCFWIAAAIVLVGPPYLDFFQKQKANTEALIGQTRKNIDRANTPTRVRGVAQPADAQRGAAK
jgi:tight adherence protein C